MNNNTQTVNVWAGLLHLKWLVCKPVGTSHVAGVRVVVEEELISEQQQKLNSPWVTQSQWTFKLC
jgi:hypothetical protein